MGSRWDYSRLLGTDALIVCDHWPKVFVLLQLRRTSLVYASFGLKSWGAHPLHWRDSKRSENGDEEQREPHERSLERQRPGHWHAKSVQRYINDSCE